MPIQAFYATLRIWYLIEAPAELAKNGYVRSGVGGETHGFVDESFALAAARRLQDLDVLSVVTSRGNWTGPITQRIHVFIDGDDPRIWEDIPDSADTMETLTSLLKEMGVGPLV